MTFHGTTLQHTATHCNTLQHTSTREAVIFIQWWRFMVPHCNTQQHTATHCNTHQHVKQSSLFSDDVSWYRQESWDTFMGASLFQVHDPSSSWILQFVPISFIRALTLTRQEWGDTLCGGLTLLVHDTSSSWIFQFVSLSFIRCETPTYSWHALSGIPRTQIHMDVSHTNPQLRVLNYFW